jgi:hypothetical protein
MIIIHVNKYGQHYGQHKITVENEDRCCGQRGHCLTITGEGNSKHEAIENVIKSSEHLKDISNQITAAIKSY